MRAGGRRIQQAVDEDELTTDTDCKLLAKLVSALHQEMPVQATTGTSVQKLQRSGQLAMKTLRLNKITA